MPDQLTLFGRPPRKTARAEIRPVAVDDGARQLAAALPESLRIGTSSWSFPGWNGLVYDRSVSKAVLARRGLAAYAQHPLLRMVGIDRSYYAPLEQATFAEYGAAVADDFRFLVKACERCTVARYPKHARYGEQRGKINSLFLDAGFATDYVVAPMLDGLGDKAGPLVFQFPPQPRSAMGGDDFADILHAFLSALPRGPIYAVEIRDSRLMNDRYAQALRDAGAVHCFTVHPRMPDVTTQHEALGNQEHLVVRWMLGHGQTYEAARQRYEPFDRIVDAAPATRRQVADLVVTRRAVAKTVSIAINNKAEGSAPLSARALAGEIAKLSKESAG